LCPLLLFFSQLRRQFVDESLARCHFPVSFYDECSPRIIRIWPFVSLECSRVAPLAFIRGFFGEGIRSGPPSVGSLVAWEASPLCPSSRGHPTWRIGLPGLRPSLDPRALPDLCPEATSFAQGSDRSQSEELSTISLYLYVV
jgi:hypothetical protein